jgi:ribosomal protein L34
MAVWNSFVKAKCPKISVHCYIQKPPKNLLDIVRDAITSDPKEMGAQSTFNPSNNRRQRCCGYIIMATTGGQGNLNPANPIDYSS